MLISIISLISHHQPCEVAVGTPMLEMRKQALRRPVIYLQQHDQQVAESEHEFRFSSQ